MIQVSGEPLMDVTVKNNHTSIIFCCPWCKERVIADIDNSHKALEEFFKDIRRKHNNEVDEDTIDTLEEAVGCCLDQALGMIKDKVWEKKVVKNGHSQNDG